MAEERKVVKASEAFARVQEDMRAMNSSILIITQKMKYLVRNEKILGRNLIVLHKKLMGSEERIALGQFGPAAGPGGASTGIAAERVEELSKKMIELQLQLQDLQQNSASRDELKEMRYVIDSINPLKFVTLQQAKELLGKKQGSSENSGRKKKK